MDRIDFRMHLNYFLLMRYVILILLFVSLITACSSHKSTEDPQASSEDGPRLKLSAFPRQGFAPMRVSFNGILEGVSQTDAEYYCLQEEWEFGDGAVSSEQPNCVPLGEEGSELKVNFFVEHLYYEKGTYTIWLTLGDKKIKSNQVAVVVLESEIGPN
jgi:hypothetical protein